MCFHFIHNIRCLQPREVLSSLYNIMVLYTTEYCDVIYDKCTVRQSLHYSQFSAVRRWCAPRHTVTLAILIFSQNSDCNTASNLKTNTRSLMFKILNPLTLNYRSLFRSVINPVQSYDLEYNCDWLMCINHNSTGARAHVSSRHVLLEIDVQLALSVLRKQDHVQYPVLTVSRKDQQQCTVV